MKVLIVYTSFHHFNTLKIAQEIAKVLHAKLVKPNEINPQDVVKYDLVGFGSGIYFWKHHKSLLEFVDRLPFLSRAEVGHENFSVSELVPAQGGTQTSTNRKNFMTSPRADIKILEQSSREPFVFKKAFIFSTRGATYLGLSHKALRDKLKAKGFKTVGEFSCFGYDTFGPYGWIGGLKKGHPNDIDLARAKDFAKNLIKQ
jgi:flavodoxin